MGGEVDETEVLDEGRAQRGRIRMGGPGWGSVLSYDGAFTQGNLQQNPQPPHAPCIVYECVSL